MNRKANYRMTLVVLLGCVLFWFVFLSRKTPNNQQITNLSGITVLTYTKNGKWTYNHNVCSKMEALLDTDDFPMQYLNTHEGPMYLYTLNIKRDGIAGRIYESKIFEPNIDEIIRYFMNKNPDASFIDIGANIGVRSLQVANFGRNSIAIEALDENLQRICASVRLNNFDNKIIIIHNAISDNHSVLNIALSDWGGRGGTYIDDPRTKKIKERDEGQGRYKTTKQIHSVKLDDLLYIPDFFEKFSNVFMKLDVEGFEHKAFAGGSEFFRKINVTGIIMEWRWHLGQSSAPEMVNRLRQWNFEPYSPDIETFTRLKWEEYNSWPHDVIWLPQK